MLRVHHPAGSETPASPRPAPPPRRRRTSSAAAPSGPGRRRVRRRPSRRARQPDRDACSTNDRYAATPALAQQVEVHPHVHAALAEVAVRTPRSAHAGPAARQGRAGSRPSRAGGTAASSQPPHASAPSARRVASPAASRRHRHSTACAPGSVTNATRMPASPDHAVPQASPWPRLGGARSSSPATSTRSHACPAGSRRRDGLATYLLGQQVDQGSVDRLHRERAVRRAPPARCRLPRSESAKPSTHRRPSPLGSGVSATVARSVVASVPSLPQSSPATSWPCSGSSRCSA